MGREMNLDLGLGAMPANEALRFEVLRELTGAEASLPGGEQVRAVAKMRQRHHTLARLLASGEAPGSAAVLSGYCSSRVSVLQNDPSFQELLAFYQGRLTIEALDMKAKLGTLAADVVSELQDRIEDEPGSFKNTELTELLKASCDRIGLGPTSTVKSFNVNATSTLAELKARVLAEQKGHVETEDYGTPERHAAPGATQLRVEDAAAARS
jgi:hypothetical protein